MKKLISIILSISMMFTALSVFVYAAGETKYILVYLSNSKDGGVGSGIQVKDLVDGQEVIVGDSGNYTNQNATMVFSHWTDKHGYIYYPGDTFVINAEDANALKRITLTAQWVKVPGVLVVYDKNTDDPNCVGSLHGSTSPELLKGSEYTLADISNPVAGLTFPLHKFVEWNTEPDGSGTGYQAGDTIIVTETITLYAIWENIEQEVTFYTVNFDANGGEGEMAPETDVPANGSITAPECGFTRSGYLFDGWNTAADGSGTTYKKWDDITVEANLTLCAMWRRSSIVPILDDSSLKNYNFRFGAQNATHFTDASTTTGKINVDVINNIKKKYNCTVDVVGFNGTTLIQDIVNSCRAGQVPADVVEANISHARAVAKQGCIADFAKCTTLNKKLFDNGMTESVTHNGHVYGVAFDSMSVNPMGVLFNKTVVDKYMKSKDVIYDYYKKGTWNFDAFELVAKTCTVDTNGDNKSDIYGVTSNTNIISMALTANAGGTALKVNEKVEATMCNDKGIYALTWLKEKIYNPGYWNYKPDIYESISSFANGDAAMFVSYLSWYGQIASSAKFEMGFVPMPKGPSQSKYITGAYDGGIFFVPKTNEKNINVVGTFLNELAAGTSNKHINNSISSMARNGFDATAQSVYKWAVTNTSPEFSIGVFGPEISAKVDQSVTDPSKSPKTVMESIKGAAQKKCDDFYAPLYGGSGIGLVDREEVIKFKLGSITYELCGGEITVIDCDDDVIEVLIPSSIENYPIISIADYAFNGCTELVSISIPKGVETIGSAAFGFCDSLTDVWYLGTTQDKEDVKIEEEGKGADNEDLLNANWRYCSFGLVTENEMPSAIDALTILHAVVGKVEFDFGKKLAGDVNGDGEISSTDALTILHRIVGKIEKFPVE